jgi:hypothetical protein
MDGLFAVKEAALRDVKERLYPITFSNLLYTAIMFLIGGAAVEYLGRYTLFRWIYLGFGAVIIASVYQQGLGRGIPQHAIFSATDRYG